MQQLHYTSAIARVDWQATIRAARLVPQTGTAGLPPPFGTISFLPISSPTRFGIGPHPLEREIPGLQVKNLWLVYNPEWMVERDGVCGLAFYFDFNGSGLSASKISLQGRNAVAPWPWEGEPGSPTDPAALSELEWRRVGGHIWQDHLVHGFAGPNSRYRGLDWLDGTPARLEDMHDPNTGEVIQSVFVPRDIPGLGVAEQTMRAADVNNTVTILVHFPRPEFAGMELVSHYPYREGVTRGGGMRSLGLDGPGNYEDPDAAYPISAARSSAANMVSAKVAGGGMIHQSIIPDPFGHWFWNRPEVMFVLWPIDVNTATRLTGTQSEDVVRRRTI